MEKYQKKNPKQFDFQSLSVFVGKFEMILVINFNFEFINNIMKNKIQLLLYFSSQQEEIPKKVEHAQSQIKINKKCLDNLIIFKSQSEQSNNQLPKYKGQIIETKRQIMKGFNMTARWSNKFNAYAAPKVLKPSLFYFQQDQSNDYDQVIKFDKKIQSCCEKKGEREFKPLFSHKLDPQDTEKKDKSKYNNNQIISLSRKQKSMTIKTSTTANCEDQIKNEKQKVKEKNKKKIKFISESQTDLLEQKNNQTANNPMPEQISNQQKKDIYNQLSQQQPILQPTAYLLQISRQIIENISKVSNQNNNNIFLNTPIPNGVRFIFEVHYYPNIFEGQYLFWICIENQMSLLMLAKKDGIKIANSVFRIYQTNTIKDIFFIAKMISNFKRDQFYIFDWEEEYKSRQVKVLGTITYGVSILNQKAITCYYPKVDKLTKQQANIFLNSLSKNLKQIYKKGILEDIIDVISSAIISPQLKSILMNQFGLKESKKNIAMIDLNNKFVIFIGKKQSARYKVVAGAGLTPIQAFSLTISHIQT